MKATLDVLTPKQHQAQKHRLATLKGSIRKISKNLNVISKVAKRTGPIWGWRVDAIRDEVNKLLAKVEMEEKMMS